VQHFPALAQLNPALGHKYTNITWRHLANQLPGYGISTQPGAAFDNNDFQMALVWDVLFLHIFNTSYETADKEVLHPISTDKLSCEGNPTYMAFGQTDRPGRLSISPRDFARFGLLY
jgi:hypothetical protein